MSRTWTVRVLLTMVYRTRYSPRRAAQELGESIDATPHTLHQVTTALKFGLTEHQFDFRPGDVLVTDEAAMSGIHTLHEVVRYALRRGADVRLVGDDKQLGAVEAGGAIRLIAHDVGAVRFREVLRFTDPDQAAASLHIREGNPVGLGYYLDHNWVAGGSRETMRDAAQRAWRADLDAGRQTLLIVPTLPVTHQRRHESQMGPYAGIPRRFRPWTTCQVSFLLEMQITASASKAEYASSARRTMSGLPRAVVSQMIALGCTARISSTSASP
jgi:hypothetical protein